jgi:hypothetical protein
MVVMGAIILFFIGLAGTAGKKNISGPKFSGSKNAVGGKGGSMFTNAMRPTA